MKALSLTQPWATLIAIGAKRIETRSWYTSYRGPIAIHASKGFPTWARETCLDDPFRTALRPTGLIDYGRYDDVESDAVERFALPLGAIVAVATLVDVRPTDSLIASDVAGHENPYEELFGDYSPGRYAWDLGWVRPLASPVPCKGALGLWDVPADVAQIVQARAEGTA